jgi:hypothetical protein
MGPAFLMPLPAWKLNAKFRLNGAHFQAAEGHQARPRRSGVNVARRRRRELRLHPGFLASD